MKKTTTLLLLLCMIGMYASAQEQVNTRAIDSLVNCMQPKKAIALIDSIETPSKAILRKKAGILSSIKKYDQAMDIYQQLTADTLTALPTDYNQLAAIKWAMGYKIDALKIYLSAYKVTHLPYFLEQGNEASIKLRDYKGTVETADQYLEKDTITSILLNKATALFQLNDSVQALDLLKIAVEKDSTNYKAVEKLAMYYNGMEEPDSALYLTKAYHKIMPKNNAILIQRAVALQQRREFRLACQTYIDLVTKGMNNNNIIYSLGVCLYMDAQYEAAYHVLTEVNKLFGEQNYLALMYLGMSENKMKKFDDAITHLEKAIELSKPQDNVMYTIYNELGDVMFFKPRIDTKGAVKYKKLAFNYNRNFKTMFQLAEAYYYDKDYTNASHIYEQLLKTIPESASGNTVMGQYRHIAEGKIKEINEKLFMQGKLKKEGKKANNYAKKKKKEKDTLKHKQMKASKKKAK